MKSFGRRELREDGEEIMPKNGTLTRAPAGNLASKNENCRKQVVTRHNPRAGAQNSAESLKSSHDD